jgi:hypothetical protein
VLDPDTPLDPRVPPTAAACFAVGSGLSLAMLHAPLWQWAGAAPVACGVSAHVLATRQLPAGVTGRRMGILGLALAVLARIFGPPDHPHFDTSLGGEVLTVSDLFAALVGLAHGVGGTLIAYYSRNEGPRRPAGTPKGG